NFKNIKKDNALTILAGPVANMLVGIILCFIFTLLANFFGNFNKTVNNFIDMFLYASLINIRLSIFYILPLPGLDGYQLIINFLPYRFGRNIYTIEKYSFIILLIFILVLWRYVIDIPSMFIFNGFVGLFSGI
ncbi:MAG: hypothetical protein LBI03_04895, partial [Clostridiales bacterium]|nr:hypothetical protein [Clostridiales bacterium]